MFESGHSRRLAVFCACPFSAPVTSGEVIPKTSHMAALGRLRSVRDTDHGLRRLAKNPSIKELHQKRQLVTPITSRRGG